jgi:Domain of unknown function (DUF5979)/Thioester domain
MRTMTIALRRACLVPVVTIVAVLALTTSASAVWTPGGLRSGTGGATELIMRGTGPGQGVTGFIAKTDNPFDPLTGYPATDPTTGFDVLNEGFAGIITASPPSGGNTLQMYCIDIRTLTQGGYGYTLGDWDAANVPLVGHIGRILNSYYPATTSPTSLAEVNQKAAAVQAAIWFFSDKYVLSTSSPLHDAVAAIVTEVIAAGPLVSPPPPTLTITPSSASGPAGSLLGPFAVTSTTAGSATVRASGATMFTDAGGSSSLADGSSVASGTQIWLRSEGAGAAVLSATASATVPTGNVYLYSGNVSGVNDAQKLILAQAGTLTTTASAKADFQPPGSLTVTKTITGPAAATHGEIVIHVVCDGSALTPDFIIAAGATGSASTTYNPVPAGSKCVVTERDDGGTAAISVVVVGSGQQVTVPAGGGVTAALSNAYTFLPGSLVVRKTISGPAAGSQAAVTIHVVCGAMALADFVIPAGSGAATTDHTYSNIPAGTACTVTETANGSSTAVDVVTVGNGQAVTVPAGGTGTAELSNDYTYNPGSLTVTKTINGPGAASHGAITIEVTCDGTMLEPFTIPANTLDPLLLTKTYNGIPGNATCFVVETVDGHQPAVSAQTLGSGQPVTVPPGGTATATITDTFQVGSLVVNKTITGRAAGAQGGVRIHVDCGVGFVYDIVIPAATLAGGQSTTFPDVPAGATCTVTEPVTGETGTVTVAASGSPQTVTIDAGGTGQANLADSYDYIPGSLTVTKAIAGSAAGQRGPITIEVVCGNTTLSPAFVIAAGTSAPSVSQTYQDIPGNSTCTVQETDDGGTTSVDVVTIGSGEDVTVGPGSEATATITDTYTPAPGSLVVQKTISGPAAGRQGAVTIVVECGDGVARSFVVASGTPVGTSSQTFDAIPAGSTCAVTETADGATSTVQVAVDGGDQTIEVGAASTEVADVSNLYTDVPGKLVVTKTIAGTAAGRQSAIEVLVDCGTPAQTYSFTIPAGAPADTVTGLIDDVEAGSTCTVTETADGSSSTISVAAVGGGQEATISAAGQSQVDLTDTFSDVVVPTTVTPTTAAPATTAPPTTVVPPTGPPTNAIRGTLPATGGGTSMLWPGVLLLGAGVTILAVTRRRPASRPRD